jgi:hypothetical protein
LTDCGHDRLQRRAGKVEGAIAMGGVCPDDEEKGQIDGSNVVSDVGCGGRAGKTAWAADGFLRTQQNASVHDFQGFIRGMSV